MRVQHRCNLRSMRVHILSDRYATATTGLHCLHRVQVLLRLELATAIDRHLARS